MPFFSCLGSRKQLPQEQNEQTSPPPYDASNAPEIVESKVVIKASDAPQWHWTNAQCREWIFAVCVHNLGLDAEESRMISEKYEGYGPSMYFNDGAYWKYILGSDQRGGSVFAQIFGSRMEKGGLPKGITFPHFERRIEMEVKSTESGSSNSK